MLKKMAERIKHHLHGSGTMTTQDIVKKSIERTSKRVDREFSETCLYASKLRRGNEIYGYFK